MGWMETIGILKQMKENFTKIAVVAWENVTDC